MYLALSCVALSIGTAALAAGKGARVTDEPDLLPGVDELFTLDADEGIVWVITIHDPDFVLKGREITIANLRDDLLLPDEGNVFQLKGSVESQIFRFDPAAGVPPPSDLGNPDVAPLVATGPVDINFNMVATQAEKVPGAKTIQLTVRGRGEVRLTDGATPAMFSANLHEVLAGPGLSPTRLHSKLELRERR